MTPPAFRISSIARLTTSMDTSLGYETMMAFWTSTATAPLVTARAATTVEKKRIVGDVEGWKGGRVEEFGVV
jgi:ascorbate-specific PTS system EIIC-type component UlaA